MYVNSSAAHWREESPLVEIADYRVWVKELRWASQIIAVWFLSPTAHWAPGWTLQFEAACLIRHIYHAICYVVKFPVLIKSPDFYIELGPILNNCRFLKSLTILAHFGKWSGNQMDAPKRKNLHHRNKRCVFAKQFVSLIAETNFPLHT